MQYNFISADNHINDPRDLYVSRLPKEFRDRAPRVLPHPGGGEGWSWDGKAPKKVFATECTAGQSLEKIAKQGGMRFDDMLPGNYDPAAHLLDMDADGVDAVVVYPCIAIAIYELPDRAFALAMMRVYNDWIVQEFQGHNPQRIIGLPLLPTDDGIEALLAEFDRCAAMGARAMFLPGIPLKPYHDPYYFPLWQRAVEANISMSFHRTFGGKPKDTSYDSSVSSSESNSMAASVVRFFAAVGPFSYMIFSGVFDRYPKLKMIAGEVNCGWLPFWIERMDERFEQMGVIEKVPVKRRPSDYVGENVFVTTLEDKAGFKLLPQYPRALKATLFSSDYPHATTSWPRTRKVGEQLMIGYSDEARHDILVGNALRAFRFS
jgi:predicted TIM-barrel fold metal-dependent hydrolase